MLDVNFSSVFPGCLDDEAPGRMRTFHMSSSELSFMQWAADRWCRGGPSSGPLAAAGAFASARCLASQPGVASAWRGVKGRAVGGAGFRCLASECGVVACRDVLWEVHVGHTWRHEPAAGAHPMEPLWKLLEAVEQDLQDMQAVHHYLRGRETRNRLRECPPAPRCRLCHSSPRLLPSRPSRQGPLPIWGRFPFRTSRTEVGRPPG